MGSTKFEIIPVTKNLPTHYFETIRLKYYRLLRYIMAPSPSEGKVAVITGSSSGIGYETVLAMARNGFTTFATLRNLEKAGQIKSVALEEKLPIHVVQLDVTDDASVQNAIQEIVKRAGRIDVVVNNAAYGLMGAFEDLLIDEIKAEYETNFYGVIRVTQAVLPIMRKQGSGRIVNISSGAGRFGYPGGSAYVSTKFALEGLSESMAYELEPFGIKVVLVEPGFIRTNFGSSMVFAKKAQNPNSPYSQMMQQMGASIEQFQKNASDPDLVANIVLQSAISENPELRYLAGKDVEAWVESKRKLSDSEFINSMKQMMK
jgi:NAD(P)-dependent dehydrogenase (short-subunit alcohol dehydrogenase family)